MAMQRIEVPDLSNTWEVRSLPETPPRPGHAQVALRILLGLAIALSSPAGTVSAAPNVPNLGEAAQRVIERTNHLRTEAGLSPLRSSEPLLAAARAFADYQARTDRYGHRSDGRSPSERALASGYSFCKLAENIAFQKNTAGFTSRELGDELVESWAESAGHRRNLLAADLVDIGVGIAHSPRTGRYYAVQMFGRPMSAPQRC